MIMLQSYLGQSLELSRRDFGDSSFNLRQQPDDGWNIIG
jgi:hypothetical protein